MFTRVSAAYDVLADPLSRAIYDLAAGIKSQTAEEVGWIACSLRV